MSDYIHFLGTGGARFVMIKGIRNLSGIFFNISKTKLIFDPGPGAIVSYIKNKIDFSKIDGILLSHKHIDHSNDINVMIEAITEGGFKKRGILMAPDDALNKEKDPVVFQYAQNYLEKIFVLKEFSKYKINSLEIETNTKLKHGEVENYGIIIDKKIGIISDTAYFKELANYFKNLEILIINMVLLNEKPNVFHLYPEKVVEILKIAKSNLAILTHFGMRVIFNSPNKIAKEIEEKSGVKTIAAYDGMKVSL